MIETLAWILVGVALVPAHRLAAAPTRGEPGEAPARSLLTAVIAIEAVAVAMVLVAGASPHTWFAIAQEDGMVEWATFLAFAMAAGWLLIVVRRQSKSWWFQGATCLLALFCIVVAGEEISWGQRLFGFRPPDLFLERNFQQEANLHNVLMHEGGLGVKLESKHLVMAIALGFCAIWPALVRTRRLAVFAPLAPSRAFLPLGIAVIAAELSYEVELTGEGAELVIGMVFLASAVTATAARPRTVLAAMLAPIVMGGLVSVVLDRIVFGSDEEGSAIARTELTSLAGEVSSHMTEKGEAKSIHKRVFTALQAGYLELPARPRSGRSGYYLDPWNNPYWVRFDRRTRRGLVYSFGPNRRRDVEIRAAGGDRGDDILVPFALPQPSNVLDTE